MGDNSDEELAIDWVPYRDRKDWADVRPLPQLDGDKPIVQIAYSDKFKDVFDYFRAIVSTREKSLRAMELTKDALRLNAANYTVWQYRRDILKELNLDLHEELDYAEEVMFDNPKNYQVWHHRRVIVEWLNDSSRELQLTEEILNMDAKNYHAWQHRQWAIKTFSLFDDELAYVDKLISEDVRNNSAWNQRFFVLKYTGFTPDVLHREINYTMNRIRYVKNNESAWNFLRGILQEGDGQMDQLPDVREFCEELYAQDVRSPYLLAFMIDMYEEICMRGQFDANDDSSVSADDVAAGDDLNVLSKKVLELCEMQQQKVDTIRHKYWEYVAGNFKVQFGKLQENYKCSTGMTA